MKKLLCALLALTMLFGMALAANAAFENVVFISYNQGKNANDGFSDTTAKQTLGTTEDGGAISELQNGGILVISGKFFIGASYVWNSNGKVTIKGTCDGVDYRKYEPATNPGGGVMKLGSGASLTIASGEVVLDDMILFQENNQNSIIVKDGATLTVTENITCMTKTGNNYYFKIKVEEGGTANINGGIFSAVEGDGNITIGNGVTVIDSGIGEVPEFPVSDATLCYVDYAGNDNNDGSSDTKGVKTWDRVMNIVPNGGTVVVSGKSYTGGANNVNEYTIPKTTNPLTITSVYEGKDYKNPDPDTNPACAYKLGSGTVLNIAGDVTFDNIILFQENRQNKIVVKSGASLTITDTVVCMTKPGNEHYYNIVVEAGGKATINGGTFSSIGGAGEITVAEGVTVLEGVTGGTDGPEDGVSNICFLNYSGSDKNDGLTPDTPVRGYTNGVLKVLPSGGTVVLTGKSYISGTSNVNAYTIPALSGPLTFTSVYNGVDYKNPDPDTNPACAFKLGSGTILNIEGDIIFDDLILFQENLQNTLHVCYGATLIITDKTVFMTKPGNEYHYKIVIDEGATAILSEEAQKVCTIENNGDLLTYVAEDNSTVVKLTIGDTVGYVNGAAKTLDAAPIIRESRTMLPVRFVAEAFGAEVKWDGATSTASVITADTTIEITIGATTAKVNGQTVTLDAPAFIENSRTYLPVRFVAENLGATVAWDGATSTATLTK
ncbi:MAG: hypothetical protein IJ002_07105 [Clostridia bacterium]|nr:hypothetical protein [Clostridia bacterium]